ncbi:sugar ABC transporter substrate-binding protein [Acidisoma silvae]|uniref:Sugar ABC transporter substrate-binding protein n=1 Tax=Acidisoma silvae TaxID=2802396 RepID=A0A963YV85_9PROT|nr:sugar ABC transporter substrate-binding protein [Acidisoma silvae]MCB8877693.1 sugar ABC transporter substrate-binding protein [Acidisoma silvae]
MSAGTIVSSSLMPKRRDLLKVVAAGGAAAFAGAARPAAAAAPVLGFSNKSLDFYFFRILQEAAKRAAAAQGWGFQAVNANFDNTTQIQQWDSLLLTRPIAMLGDTVDSQAMVSAVKKANAAKIPVGLVDSLATGGNVAISVAFDNYQGGVMAANTVIDLLKKKYNGQAKGIVLNCYGALASDAWRARKLGWDATFKNYPDINMLDRPTDGLLKNMLSVTVDTLSQYPNLDAIHAPSDTPSRGVVTALKQRHLWHKIGDPKHVIFVTIDGEPIGLQWIKEGYMDADISQDPIAYSEIAVEMLAKYSVKGQAVPLGKYTNKKYYWESGDIVQGDTGPRLIIPPFVMNATNASDPRMWGNVASNTWGIAYQ